MWGLTLTSYTTVSLARSRNNGLHDSVLLTYGVRSILSALRQDASLEPAQRSLVAVDQQLHPVSMDLITWGDRGVMRVVPVGKWQVFVKVRNGKLGFHIQTCPICRVRPDGRMVWRRLRMETRKNLEQRNQAEQVRQSARGEDATCLSSVSCASMYQHTQYVREVWRHCLWECTGVQLESDLAAGLDRHRMSVWF